NEYLLLSEHLQVVVAKSGLGVKIYDHDDRVLCEDAGGFSARRTVMQGWQKLQLEKKCHRKEVFFGLGDKSCGTNLAGKKFQNWCTDSYAFDRQDDPLYRAIPFYYSLYQGLAYGIFLDNTFRTHFDFDQGEAGSMRFWAEGGELNYYFLYGPAPADVTRAYARLTGRQALPPLWTLGYHQCRWSYYPDTEVLAIADEFRAREIPCDALYLDIDYMDGYRCFTWHPERFPDPKRLIDDLRERGFATVVMIDPGIKDDPDYAVYQDGLAKNVFVRSADGDLAKAPVWPGFCAYPDFTHPAVRAWWGPLHKALYQDLGVSGFWNDMNEPAVFHVNHKTLPNNVVHHYDGYPCSHRKAHNVYGQQMARASWEGLKALQPERRPYLLTRAAYSGGQRFAAVWTGDNVADWENLQIANIQCQRLAISGFSFCGTDIGGFTGCTDGELFVRWLQLAVFHPLMRTHSKGSHAVGDAITPTDTEIGAIAEHSSEPPIDEIQLPEAALTPPFRQEPWSYGEKWTALAKKAIELRYALLPCLYTAMWRNSQDGSPVLQHLAFADPNDPKLWEQERDFLFGEHLLVSPVVQARLQRQGVYLPKGQWYY
ncbi:MAG: TIM-barrel domain-containing protein, partial [Saprospiraceae bacterium]